MFLRNMYRLRSAVSFVMTTHSRQILSKKGQTELKHVPLEIQPQSEELVSHTSFLTNLFL
jgi:hypothetical protein